MECMKYCPPTDHSGHEYYIPVVVKNKDYLMGYLSGIECAKDLIEDIMDKFDVDVDLGSVDMFLDSSRFNDILENGKRESDMSKDELKAYRMGVFQEILERMSSKTPENDVDDDRILKVECTCGYGYYSWKSYKDIPSSNVKCSNCGNILIDYTNMNDYEFEYDGGTND